MIESEFERKIFRTVIAVNQVNFTTFSGHSTYTHTSISKY